MGKGSRYRPVDKKKYDENYEKIFVHKYIDEKGNLVYINIDKENNHSLGSGHTGTDR